MVGAMLLTNPVLNGEPPASSEISFKVAAIDEAVSFPLRFGAGEGAVIREIPWMHRGGPYRMNMGSVLEFLREPPPTDGSPPRILARVAIPDGIKSPLLLFSRMSTAENGFRVRVVEDSAEAFPYGSYRLSNATSRPISGSIGAVKIDIEPGGEQIFTPSVENRRDLEVRLSSGGRLFAETFWTYESALRKHVLFLDDDRDGTIMRSFNEWRKKEAGQ